MRSIFILFGTLFILLCSSCDFLTPPKPVEFVNSTDTQINYAEISNASQSSSDVSLMDYDYELYFKWLYAEINTPTEIYQVIEELDKIPSPIPDYVVTETISLLNEISCGVVATNAPRISDELRADYAESYLILIGREGDIETEFDIDMFGRRIAAKLSTGYIAYFDLRDELKRMDALSLSYEGHISVSWRTLADAIGKAQSFCDQYPELSTLDSLQTNINFHVWIWDGSCDRDYFSHAYDISTNILLEDVLDSYDYFLDNYNESSLYNHILATKSTWDKFDYVRTDDVAFILNERSLISQYTTED